MATVAGLPGEDLVRKGLADLARGEESVEALLVSIGAPRLEGVGLSVSGPIPDAEHRLYESLAVEDPDSAHSRYNALLRRLVSFEHAAARNPTVTTATADSVARQPGLDRS